MKLYDEIIKKIVDHFQDSENLLSKATEWATVSDRSMILRSDMAFELGADFKPGVGMTLITDSEELVSGDAVKVLGPELSEISGDGPFARIALVRVDSSVMGQGEALYNAIRKLEYVRYHFHPEGFMMRVSSSKEKETVRVGKEALSRGLSFATVGKMMIDAFKQNKAVTDVTILYITRGDFDYKKLLSLGKEAEGITKTIDHIFKNVTMDCNVCNLQEICDEVEGLRELHFGQETK